MLRTVCKTAKIIRIISKTVSIILISVIVLLAVLLAGVRLVGLTPYTVLSGSMEPTYHVGSIVYVKKAEPLELKAGDAITYKISGGTVVTHRIVEVVNGEDGQAPSFKTKGDAADMIDGTPVKADNIIGKVMFSVPYLGYLSDFIHKPHGLFVTVAVCVLALVLCLLQDLLTPPKAASPENTPNEDKTSEEQ